MKHEIFNAPGKWYREVPFWSWNDDLEPDELRRQVGLMDEAGWGGFFMHSRVGLITPYLGKKWMECVEACIDEAKQRGMFAWLYDEDKWPSGFSGGLTTARSEDFRSRVLVCQVSNTPALIEERIAAFTARQDGADLVDFQPFDDGDAFDGDERVLVQFYVRVDALGSSTFNGTTYLDTLNPEAVAAFIEDTHEKYAALDAAREAFGGAVPGIFTDEPAIMNTQTPELGVQMPGSLSAVAWTSGMAAFFEERRGYDLIPHLPSLFYNTGDYHKVRYDFWKTVTERFVEAYSKQIYDWCEERDLMLTGHYLLEDDLWVQTRWAGAVMPHYEYEQLPGIDKLGRNLFRVLTVKQIDSAVCQLGKPRALCEIYGCSGGDFSFAGRKWLGDWAYLLGVTLNNPHLSLYSMKGARKRDYPANLYYPQPWWPENTLIADYFARLSYALSEGQRAVDVLVIHPMGSAWSLYRPSARREVDEIDLKLDQLDAALLGNQRDFHYGDEMLMEKYAKVEDGQFIIGEMAYKVVVIPAGTVTLAENTVTLLNQFASQGGTIFSLDGVPTRVEGVRGMGIPKSETRDADPRDILPTGVRVIGVGDLAGELDKVLPFDVRIPNSPEIWVHHRTDGEKDWYFIANTNRDEGRTAKIRIRDDSGRTLESWDPATGEVQAVPAVTRKDGVIEIALEFAPAGSHLLVLREGAESGEDDGMPQMLLTAGEVVLGGAWEVAEMEPNALTLDTVYGRAGGRPWMGPAHILDAGSLIAAVGTGTPFALKYDFMAEIKPEGPVYLVMETPEKYAVTVNGHDIATDEDAGYWRDISFRKLDISGAVRAGKNDIIVSGTFALGMELESVYIVGDFGVRAEKGQLEGETTGQTFYRYAPDFAITAPPESLNPGDLTPQGLPFFAGRLTLRRTVTLDAVPDDAALRFEDVNAAVLRVKVNGTDAGALVWAPYEIDVTDLLQEGANTVEVEVVSTLRNLLGPHHLRGGDQEWTGPGQFRDKARWIDDYVLVPLGFGSARLVLSEVVA